MIKRERERKRYKYRKRERESVCESEKARKELEKLQEIRGFEITIATTKIREQWEEKKNKHISLIKKVSLLVITNLFARTT